MSATCFSKSVPIRPVPTSKPQVISSNRRLAETVLRPHAPAFIHGDLHLEHVFVDGDEVSGIIDWSEARGGDALFDIASLTLTNEAHLDDLGCARR